MWGKGRFNHNGRKKGLNINPQIFLVVLDSFFFNGWKALIEKEALRKTSVEELVKFKMFKELALFCNGTVLLFLGVDVSSHEQQGRICYLVLHLPWVSIAPKPTGGNCWKMFWQRGEPLCVQVGFGLSLTEQSFILQTISLKEMWLFYRMKQLSRSESGRTSSRWMRC